MASRARQLAVGLGLGLSAAGCQGPKVSVPAGYLPTPSGVADRQSGALLAAAPTPPAAPLASPAPGVKLPPAADAGAQPFNAPGTLPGFDAPVGMPLKLPFAEGTPLGDRQSAVKAAFPAVVPVGATSLDNLTGPPLTLAELQQTALANSPVIRQAAAAADASYGQVIQAGLYPNPTVGYQGDQIQPGPRPYPLNNSGQQGAFINQLIRTAGKVRLGQQVTGYDYVNALVAVRRAQVDVTLRVRSGYFAVLSARQGVEVNKSLAGLADEVYRLQQGQLAAGVAAGYELYLLHAQAVLARNGLAAAEATEKAAWRQLAAAVGQPDLPRSPLAGRADVPVPVYDFDTLRARMLDQHTDILTARNTLGQAQTNLVLQRRTPTPDIQANSYSQYDSLARNYQLGLQIGFTLPVNDANQGNIRAAQATIARSQQGIQVAELNLTGLLAEAVGRYELNRAVAENYRALILPSLARNYRGLVENSRRVGNVAFGDIVAAQQNLVTALQAYLAALQAQWQAVVDVANLGQLDELYPEGVKP